MDGLRWLLLFFGILVIAGVYAYSRRERGKPEQEILNTSRVAPTLDVDGIEVAEDSSDVAAATPVEESRGDRPGEAAQKIVTLRLIARDGGAFRGDELILSLRGIGLRHGKFGIFHRHDGNDEERTIFCAARCFLVRLMA